MSPPPCRLLPFHKTKRIDHDELNHCHLPLYVCEPLACWQRRAGWWQNGGRAVTNLRKPHAASESSSYQPLVHRRQTLVRAPADERAGRPCALRSWPALSALHPHAVGTRPAEPNCGAVDRLGHQLVIGPCDAGDARLVYFDR